MRRVVDSICAGLLCAGVTFFALAQEPAAFAAPPSQPQVSMPRQPLRFESNQGQVDPRVRFLARGPGYTLFLTGEGATLDLRQTKDHAAALRMTLPGSDPSAQIGGEERSPVHTSYFIGKDPSKWHSNVPSYQKVRYRSLYPGIDLVFYGSEGQLEYDFVVAPQADPARIALAFEGAEKLEVDAEGTLLVNVPGGEPLRFHKPVVYQQDGPAQRQVAGAFALKGHSARFTLGEYDRAKPLVIDPVLKYSSYFSFGYDTPMAATGDATGNGYIVGFATATSKLPTTSGVYQTTNHGGENAYVAKFSPSGGLLFSTYLGGSGNDGYIQDFIQLDSAGNVWVAGFAGSPDFPGTGGGWQPTCQVISYSCQTDFLAKLNPTGTQLLYATYTSPYYYDGFLCGFTLDKSGNVYAAGTTANPNFPTTPNAYLTACPYDSGAISGCNSNFFLKLNPSLTGAAALAYSSFFAGGYDDYEYVAGIAVDGAGYVYLTGQPGWGVFLAKFDLTAGANGLVYNVSLGANYASACLGCLTFDANGNLYVTGWANGNGSGVVTPGAYQTAFEGGYPAINAFVSRLDPATGNVLYGTLLGSTSSATSVGADSAGNVYLLGWTGAAGFPLQNPIQSAFPSSPLNGGVMFVASFDPTLSTLRWSTFLGDPVAGGVPPGGIGDGPSSPSLGVDPSGNVFVAGSVQTGVNLPTVLAYQPAPGPDATIGLGGFVARISATNAPGIALGPGALNFPNTDVGSASAAQTVYILAAGSQPLDIISIAASGNYPLASDNCPAVLAGGASCQVTIEFKPKSGGALSGYLTVVTNARTARAALSGTGVPVPRIAVTPKKLTFPATPIGTPSAPLPVTIYSTGSALLGIIGISIGGTNYVDFSETGCPASLEPGQNCTVNVVMTPLVDGPLSADLVINTNAVSGAVNPALYGSGPDYTMSANPPSATVSAGGSATSTITLTPEAGLSGTVTLVCSVPSGSGITCAFAPKKVTLAGAPATSTATISTPAALASGSYNVTILGTFTGLPYRKTTVQLTVR